MFPTPVLVAWSLPRARKLKLLEKLHSLLQHTQTGEVLGDGTTIAPHSDSQTGSPCKHPVQLQTSVSFQQRACASLPAAAFALGATLAFGAIVLTCTQELPTLPEPERAAQ